MKSTFRLFRVAGIDVGIHYTWILIVVLITWSLAQGYFPQNYPGWQVSTYWIVGFVSAILLFISVLLHEIAHSLVAKSRGMRVGSITLFIFGGVSNLQDEPQRAGVEFFMAIIGPVTSLVLAGIFWGAEKAVGTQFGPVRAVLGYMWLINLILGIFNLIPGFPLDGGRVLRSILWGTTGNLVKSTNIAAAAGRYVGWGLIGYGVFMLISGNFFGGLWIAFIGWFLSSAADASRQELSVREALKGVKVSQVMNPVQDVITRHTPVEELVWNIFNRHHGRAVTVADGERVIGIVTVTDVKGLPQERWRETPVEKIMTRSPVYSVSPDDGLDVAMKLITEHDINQVLVLQDGKYLGLVGRADIVSYLRMHQELGMKPKQQVST